MAAEHVKLEPLELGQLFDRSLKLYRRNLKLLFTLSAFTLALSYIIIKPQVNLLWVALRAAIDQRFYDFESGVPDVWWTLLRNGCFLISSTVIMISLAEGLIVEAGAKLYLGEPVSFGQCLRRFVPKAPRFILTRLVTLAVYFILAVGGFALMLVASFYLFRYLIDTGMQIQLAGFVAAGLTTLVLGLPIIGLVFWLALCWVLAPEAVVLEGRGCFAALGRSMKLLRRRDPHLRPKSHLTRAVILLVAYTAIYSSVDGVIATIYFVVGAVSASSSGQGLDSLLYSPAYIPQAVGVPLELAMTFCDAALQPLVWLAMLVLYFDIRVRHEGYDLERLADGLQPAAAPAAEVENQVLP